MTKNTFFALSAVLASLIVGCSTTPVAVAPVGPNPLRAESKGSQGELQVYSSLIEQSDDENQGGDGSPVWSQHTDYDIYNMDGNQVKHVGNTIGRYERAPRRVALAPGRYLVEAQAKDYLRVEVPVMIQSGRLTRVHLDDDWKLPARAKTEKLVSLPNGRFVGWRSRSTQEFGIN